MVRHGENPANLSHEFSCRKVDYSLTEKGRLQALQTAQALAEAPVDEVWSSPLVRARETAAFLVAHRGLPVQVLEDFREMDVGDLEGFQPTSEAWSVYLEVMGQWFGGNPAYRFPGGETRTNLVQRFHRGLDHITKGKDGRTLVVVGHGGIFTHGVAELCAIVDQRTFFARDNANCSISEIEVHREDSSPRFVLKSWANVDHLSGEAALVVNSVPESALVRNL